MRETPARQTAAVCGRRGPFFGLVAFARPEYFTMILVFADFSALDDAGEHHANRDHRQDVQKAPHCVGAHRSQEPEHDEDQREC